MTTNLTVKVLFVFGALCLALHLFFPKGFTREKAEHPKVIFYKPQSVPIGKISKADAE